MQPRKLIFGMQPYFDPTKIKENSELAAVLTAKDEDLQNVIMVKVQEVYDKEESNSNLS